VIGPSKHRLWRVLGPGLITGAADDDPSGIATYSQAGAQFGFGLAWTLLFTYPLMVVIQAISARIGRTTGRGIAGNIRVHYANWLLQTKGLLWPRFAPDRDFWLTVVAILGTTISPYLFFWQAAQEVEDTKAEPVREPLRRRPSQGADALARIQLDTIVGMGVSNLVALAILATTAATLHAGGVHDLTSAAQAAEALRPIAGHFAFALFALGIIGTGLLSVPVLAGSAAYALGEARRWPVGLSRQPLQAKAFYATIIAATLLGAAANVLSISPVKALVWSAVVNAIVAVPVMALLMRMATNVKILGDFTISLAWSVIGWLATGVMAIASIVFMISLLLSGA
jgi:Mn2+/Fe2+ NRAMP family transporter